MADEAPTLEDAAQRLDRAMAGLEARIKALKARNARGEGDLFDAPSAGPSERERELETAAAEASAALGRAADEVRSILNAEA